MDGNGNKTYPFFVYGTFPLFLVRYIADWINQTGYSQIHIVGRYLSGLLSRSCKAVMVFKELLFVIVFDMVLLLENKKPPELTRGFRFRVCLEL